MFTLFLSDLSAFMDSWSGELSGLQNPMFSLVLSSSSSPHVTRLPKAFAQTCKIAMMKRGPGIWDPTPYIYLKYPHGFHGGLEEVSWTAQKNYWHGDDRELCYILPTKGTFTAWGAAKALCKLFWPFRRASLKWKDQGLLFLAVD